MRFNTALVFLGALACGVTSTFSALGFGIGGFGGGVQGVNRTPYSAGNAIRSPGDLKSITSLQYWGNNMAALSDEMQEQLTNYRDLLQQMGDDANTAAASLVSQQFATVIGDVAGLIDKAKSLWSQAAAVANNQITLQLAGDQQKAGIGQLVSASAALQQQALELTLEIENRLQNLQQEIAGVIRQATAQKGFSSSKSFASRR